MQQPASGIDSPFQRCVDAPVMGFGLGIDIFDDSPAYQRLIENHRESFDYLEIYTRGDWEHSEPSLREIAQAVPHTYHHEGLDPVGPRLCARRKIEGCAQNLGFLNAPWCVEELAVRYIDGRYTDFFFPAILTQESLEQSVRNLITLQEYVPVPLLPEIAPYEIAMGDIHVLDFLSGIAHGANMGVVLDLGHLWSWQLCQGKGDDPLEGIKRMDLSRVIEVHLAGARVDKMPNGSRIYRDLHGAGPIPQASLTMLEALADKMPNLRAITVEVENATEAAAVEQLNQVRQITAAVNPSFRRADDAA